MDNINPVILVVISMIMAALPIIIGLSTCYIKLSIVFGLLKSAFGANNIPSGIIVMVLSLSLTMYIMSPVWNSSMEKVDPKKINGLLQHPTVEALSSLGGALEPWRAFLKKHAGESELRSLAELANPKEVIPNQNSLQNNKGSNLTKSEESFTVLIPAFILSELKEAFAMGFVLLLPFLVVDMIIANILVGMGMYMVSPMIVSLPIKLILFVSIDGWNVLFRSLIESYRL